MKLLTDYKQPNTEVYWGKWGQWWWSGHIPSLLRNAVYILCLMDCFSGLILRCRMMGLWAVFCFFSISGIVYVMLVPCTSSCPALKETPLAAFAPCGPAALPWEKGEHPLEQHSWHGGGGGESAAKQKECPNITYWELTRGQWNDLVQLKWEWSSWFIFHKQSGFSSKDCYLFLPLPHPAVASESKTLCYCPSAAPQSVKQSSFLTSGKASALNMLSNSLALSEKTPLSRI